MLRVDPKQRNRLIEIIRNLTDRIDEARANGWLGEVQGLQISLDAARAKLVSLDRARRSGGSITQLEIPMIRKQMTNSCSGPSRLYRNGPACDQWVSGHQATDQSSMPRERGSRLPDDESGSSRLIWSPISSALGAHRGSGAQSP